LPALLLNYFGQGALILHDKGAVSNPFFHQIEGWLRYPLVALATAATVIASQAVISGVFSLTQQAVQLGYSPRLTIAHTSKKMEGQIYLPGINYAMMIGCVGLVLGFRSSSNLAAAYGVAVTATMAITSTLFFVVAHKKWKWPLYWSVPLTAGFLVLDFAFLTSNFTKIPNGGWFPLLVAGLLYFLAITWKRGSKLLRNDYLKREEPLPSFVRRIKREKVARTDAAAVFLSAQPDYAPVHLEVMARQVHAIPKRVVILVVSLSGVPRVPEEKRAEVKELPDGFVAVVAKYGYTEQPQPVAILERLEELGAREGLDTGKVSYFVHKEVVTAGGGDGMSGWRKQLYSYMYRNSRSPAEFFGLPADRIVELGSRTEL
jgi:KUP system potassium uptake protein